MRQRFCLVALLTLVGCWSFSGPTGSESSTVNIGTCDPVPCAKVSLSGVPELPNQLSGAVKELISAEVARVLYAPLDEQPGERFSASNLLGEIRSRQDELATAGVSPEGLTWTLERRAAVRFANDSVITIEITNQGYLGGAHSFQEKSVLTFDARDGHRFALQELIADDTRPMLRTIAEAELRRVRDIPPGRSLSEHGFFVQSGEPFQIAENFGIVENGLLLHYNPYDIAPYVMGPTDLVLPKDVVLPLLKGEAERVAHLFDLAGKSS